MYKMYADVDPFEKQIAWQMPDLKLAHELGMRRRDTATVPSSFSLCAWDTKYNDTLAFIVENKDNFILDERPSIPHHKLKTVKWTFSHEMQSIRLPAPPALYEKGSSQGDEPDLWPHHRKFMGRTNWRRLHLRLWCKRVQGNQALEDERSTDMPHDELMRIADNLNYQSWPVILNKIHEEQSELRRLPWSMTFWLERLVELTKAISAHTVHWVRVQRDVTRQRHPPTA